MGITEKAAYLKGLADGLKLDPDKDANKLLLAVVDTIGEMAELVDEIDMDLSDFTDQLDAVDESLADLEEYCYDECCCDDDECCCDDDDCCCGEELYDVVCPTCGEKITVDEGILEDGGCECPNCGESLEFDFDLEDDDEDADE